MTEENKQTRESEPVILSFMQSVTDLWSGKAKTLPRTADISQEIDPGIKNRFMEQWQTNLNLLKSFSQLMSEPGSADAAAKSINALPDIFLKMAQSTWDAVFQIQNHLLEKAGKIGQRTEAYNFDNLDQEVFKALTEVYEKELRQYLHIPPLGLTRFYQERFNELLDKHNLFETTLAEFLSILYLPMEKSIKVLQEKLQSLAQEGIMPRDTREHYVLWLRILEGHYMNLFKSKEYTDALHNTLNRMEDFIIAKNETMRDFLQFLAVPTHKDMDELYREFHILKKRVKVLEKQLKIVPQYSTND
jgi:polyhydroxyalkanoate synthase subunit PhaE